MVNLMRIYNLFLLLFFCVTSVAAMQESSLPATANTPERLALEKELRNLANSGTVQQLLKWLDSHDVSTFNIDAPSSDKFDRKTALMFAASKGCADKATSLMARGASGEIKSACGLTAVDYAASPYLKAIIEGGGIGSVGDNSYITVPLRFTHLYNWIHQSLKTKVLRENARVLLIGPGGTKAESAGAVLIYQFNELATLLPKGTICVVDIEPTIIDSLCDGNFMPEGLDRLISNVFDNQKFNEVEKATYGELKNVMVAGARSLGRSTPVLSSRAAMMLDAKDVTPLPEANFDVIIATHSLIYPLADIGRGGGNTALAILQMFKSITGKLAQGGSFIVDSDVAMRLAGLVDERIGIERIGSIAARNLSVLSGSPFSATILLPPFPVDAEGHYWMNRFQADWPSGNMRGIPSRPYLIMPLVVFSRDS